MAADKRTIRKRDGRRMARRKAASTGSTVNVAFSKVVRNGSPVWTQRDFKEFAREGYQYNAIVYACIELIRDAVSSVRIEARRIDITTGELKPMERTDEVQRLIERPNSMMDMSELIGIMVGFYLLTGNAYLERVPRGKDDPNARSGIIELWPWPSYAMKPAVGMACKSLPDEDRPYSKIPVGYLYSPGSALKAWDVDPITGQANLLHWKKWNPLNTNIGMSPIEAAAMSIDINNDANGWNKGMLQNQAQPSGVMTNKAVLDDDEYRQVIERMEDHRGVVNARDQMILEGGFEWQQMGLTPVEMDFLSGKKDAASSIATAFKVPSQMMNIEGAQTYANYSQARLSLYQDNAIPTLRNLLGMMTRWLQPVYGNDLVLTFDENKITALAEHRIDMIRKLSGTQEMTINEIRSVIGVEKYVTGANKDPADQIWLPAGLLPIESDPLGEPATNEELEAVDHELGKPDSEEEEEIQE